MIEVKLHDIGEGMTEADINCFLVKPGDSVNIDDPLVEVQTDKMTAEIPSPKSGIVKELLVEQGQTVRVGTTLLLIEDGNTVELPKEVVKAVEPKQVLIFETNKSRRVMASPYTRKIARENQVDLSVVPGTGPAGRITDEDVYRFLEKGDTIVNTPIESANEIEKVEKGAVSSLQTPNSTETIPFRGRRKQIAKSMVRSVYTIPHCTHFEEVDVTNLIKFRNELKTLNKSISATAFFIKAISICLKEFPIFNAELDEDNEQIKLKSNHNIGIATDTPEGLIVPVIRDVQTKSLLQIHDQMKILTQKAQANKLTMNDITGGTFTISNVGPLGGSIGATPIIQHPEVGLISFHKTKKMPVVTDDDQIVIRSIMNLSMSFDHRVTDGATAVAFTNRFAALIKDPKLLLLEMI
ncbi:2-oxo acid dehydrogenase subunit E2 [Bacillus luteolus]|uniref:Dihydrolipoamide acetyltransferase component of pyruvate dehydrogenase complex n=1 Tax=Litchfieldia luteola TaxID=682179 RepID=A0ABR9QMI1_9BACI|nr:dihydrolipoamide acetyltransferase family protein [Cytobacillus luteolus]MBE4909703.1 2-oxo acid dehydrogenase subunit E2 [Cytobacillus luteolus]MBP1941257.1 pyruvate dehydrogenase E2 component (dihydrolipoamide acetyltransferase) [Cytobacillus luteolus]